MEYTLRENQMAVVKEISTAIFKNNHKRITVVANTAFGKTIISHYMISALMKNGYKCLFTAPRRKLVFQTKEKFGFGNLLMATDTINEDSLCTIGTLNTISSR